VEKTDFVAGCLLAIHGNPNLPEDFMNQRIRSTWSPAALALLLGVSLSGIPLNAQKSPPPDQQTQPPAQRQAPDQAGQQAPDSQPQQTDGKTFAGTIVKSGDKWMLQDAAGTSYDIDRQDLARKYEGKQVRINGTLDPDGKTIHVK
jgi:hypothetical protein